MPMITLPPAVRPSWKIRRRIVIVTLLWCGAMVTYLAVWGRDINLSETVANGALLLMASVIGSYVFGAVWDDKNQTQAEVDVRTASVAPAPAPPGDQIVVVQQPAPDPAAPPPGVRD